MDVRQAGSGELKDLRQPFESNRQVRFFCQCTILAFQTYTFFSITQAKDKYVFWETQPVAQFGESGEGEEGPIDTPKTVYDVRKEPYNLPDRRNPLRLASFCISCDIFSANDSFEWCVCNLNDDMVAHEVYELLSNNYVEDEDNMFRFKYSASFLKWCLLCPGHRLEWLVGVRVKASRKLVGFISAIPANIRVNGKTIRMVEINFLCVHKKLRSKRLAPVLIKEITRRVNKCDIWQAAYTAGVLLPKPVATCRYYHRSLNPRKLIDVGFSRLAPRMTMARTIKLFKLPDSTSTPGLRECRPDDAPKLADLLMTHLAMHKLAPIFTPEEVAHWFQNVDDVVNAFVVESIDTPGNLTDFVSFYTLPSSILGHPQHTELKAAYLYYTVANSVPLRQLVSDAMVLAAARGYDVFNALDLMHNEAFLRELKFGQGDGQLHYYLYNWRLGNGRGLVPRDVGLVLM
uniref:Glycylpeptide N-tetradecanoyltransferase n=1 Tax=Volvox carteri f. nagariensis TaxID=3068 RepID=D9CJ81_VOLCA|nr:NMT1m [Volvox carteri f. nagariensis]